MTQLQGAVVAAAACLVLYAYLLTLLVTDEGVEGFPGPVRFIATLSPARPTPSLLTRLTGGFFCIVSLGLLLFLVTVRSYEFDSTQLAVLYLAIALAALWTVYLVRALRRQRAMRRSIAPRDLP